MARKSNDEVWIVVLAAALVGIFTILFLTLRGLMAFSVHTYKRWLSKEPLIGAATEQPKYSGGQPTMIIGDDYIECRNFMELRDWDSARQVLQRIAYTMPDRPAEEKKKFTALMTEFAKDDPLVGSVHRTIVPLLQQQPGTVQSSIYKHLPGIGQEEARYAIYFLEQLGSIRREKSGRSYKLYLANEVIDV